FEDNFVP
nr:Chain Q, AMPHIPHYSIN [Rattus norvegicus]